MNITKIIQRFCIPRSLISAIYWLKFKCIVSPRSEVDFSTLLKIGKGTRISSFTKVKVVSGFLDIGSNVSIGPSCFISAREGGIAIGDYAMVGARSSIIGSNYKYDRLDVPICLQERISKGITIGRDVWIGSGSVILDGSQIGNGSIITPNSVVSATIPDNVIAQGNPAKVIFKRR